MPNLILIYIILLITIILTAALVILNRHTAKKNEENQDTSYTYLDAFGFSEFNLFNDDKGKHY